MLDEEDFYVHHNMHTAEIREATINEFATTGTRPMVQTPNGLFELALLPDIGTGQQALGEKRVWRDYDGDTDLVVIDGVGTFPPGSLTLSYTAGTQTLSITETASGTVLASGPLSEWRDEYGNPYPDGATAVNSLNAISAVQNVPDYTALIDAIYNP